MSAFERLAVMVSGFDPWWLIAAALALIIGELLLLGTSDTGLIVSTAIILVALLNAVGMPGYIQVWAFPLGLFGGYFGQRKFFGAITYKGGEDDNPYRKKNYVGKKGLLIVKETKNESEDYFFDYKKTMPLEVEHEVKVVKTTKVLIDETGEILPAIEKSGLLKDGQMVLVISEYNGSLVVKSREE